MHPTGGNDDEYDVNREDLMYNIDDDINLENNRSVINLLKNQVRMMASSNGIVFCHVTPTILSFNKKHSLQELKILAQQEEVNPANAKKAKVSLALRYYLKDIRDHHGPENDEFCSGNLLYEHLNSFIDNDDISTMSINIMLALTTIFYDRSSSSSSSSNRNNGRMNTSELTVVGYTVWKTKSGHGVNDNNIFMNWSTEPADTPPLSSSAAADTVAATSEPEDTLHNPTISTASYARSRRSSSSSHKTTPDVVTTQVTSSRSPRGLPRLVKKSKRIITPTRKSKRINAPTRKSMRLLSTYHRGGSNPNVNRPLSVNLQYALSKLVKVTPVEERNIRIASIEIVCASKTRLQRNETVAQKRVGELLFLAAVAKIASARKSATWKYFAIHLEQVMDNTSNRNRIRNLQRNRDYVVEKEAVYPMQTLADKYGSLTIKEFDPTYSDDHLKFVKSSYFIDPLYTMLNDVNTIHEHLSKRQWLTNILKKVISENPHVEKTICPLRSSRGKSLCV